MSSAGVHIYAGGGNMSNVIDASAGQPGAGDGNDSMVQVKQDLAALVQRLGTPAAEEVIGTLPDHMKQDLAASVVQGLDPDQQQAAAEGVIGTLSDHMKQDLAASVVQGLDPDQQQAAAEGVVGALPGEAKQDLVASVVQGLEPDQQQAAAQKVLSALPTAQAEQVAQSVIGTPDKRTQQVLWYLVVSTLTAAVFVFGTMAFVLVYQSKVADAPLALATTALGGIVGLVATSPGGRMG
jgi:hypothetical protein